MSDIDHTHFLKEFRTSVIVVVKAAWPVRSGSVDLSKEPIIVFCSVVMKDGTAFDLDIENDQVLALARFLLKK